MNTAHEWDSELIRSRYIARCKHCGYEQYSALPAPASCNKRKSEKATLLGLAHSPLPKSWIQSFWHDDPTEDKQQLPKGDIDSLKAQYRFDAKLHERYVYGKWYD